MRSVVELERVKSDTGSPKVDGWPSRKKKIIFTSAGVFNRGFTSFLKATTPIKYIFPKFSPIPRMSAAPDKRLNMLQGHLTENKMISENESFLETLDCHASGGCNEAEHSYCVVLPEKLTPQGPWLVRRLVPSCS